MKEIGREHKVVLVLDHGPQFAQLSGDMLPITLKDSASNESKEVAFVNKSLWTLSLECVIEIYRIVGDLFYNQPNLLRVVIAEKTSFYLQKWGERVVSLRDSFPLLYDVGPAKEGDLSESYSLSGFKQALLGLGEITKHQKQARDAEEDAVVTKCKIREVEDEEMTPQTGESCDLKNVGSIVLFSSFSSLEELTAFENSLTPLIEEWNTNVVNLDRNRYIPIHHVYLNIVNTYPVGKNVNIVSHPQKPISPFLTTCVFNREAGSNLVSVAHGVCIEIYDLISTTVSGIPMKEEAQKGQSVNYDVELLHPKSAHDQLERLGLVGEKGFLKDCNDAACYPTFRLAWATPSPRQAWNLFPRTRTPFSVTPSSVNSRPSVCLTSFLLSGRVVMLEVARKGPAEELKPNVNQKLISHTLVSHSGRIYIHSIDIERIAVLDDQSPSNDIDEVVSLPDSISYPSDVDPDSDYSDSENEANMEGITVNGTDSREEPMETEDASNSKSSLSKADLIRNQDDASDFGESSDSEYEDDLYPSSSMVDKSYDLLDEKSTLRVDEMCQLIKNHMLRPPKPDDQLPLSDTPCYQPIRNLRRATRFFPINQEGSILFNIHKTTKMPSIMSTYQKAELSNDDIQELKKMLTQLVELREREIELADDKWKANSKKIFSPSEQFKEVSLELSLFMSNYVNNTTAHMELFDFFQNLVKNDSVKVTTDDVLLDDLHSIPFENQPLKKKDRSFSPPVAKKQKIPWKTNEVLKIGDWFNNQSAGRFKPHSKEFEARAESNSRIVQLYKGLDLSNAPPRGEGDRS